MPEHQNHTQLLIYPKTKEKYVGGPSARILKGTWRKPVVYSAFLDVLVRSFISTYTKA